MNPLARRAAVTLAVPIALLWAEVYVRTPGVPYELIARAGGGVYFSPFAIGIRAALSAYLLVELAALVVPAWSSLRLSGPVGRVKLDWAARILFLAIATLQAFGVARTWALTADAGGERYDVSVPIAATTLIAGACVQYLAARWVSERGLVNGLILLEAIDSLRGPLRGLGLLLGLPLPTVDVGDTSVDALLPRGQALVGVAIAVAAVAVATWGVLRKPDASARDAGGQGVGGAPYRDAQAAEAARPWVPVPSGSLAALWVGSWLFSLLRSLELFGVSLGGLMPLLEKTFVRLPLILAVAVAATIVFTRLLYRPAEIAEIAKRLGIGARGEAEAVVRAAVGRSFAPTLAFLALLLFAEMIFRQSLGADVSTTSVAFGVALAVAVVMDIAASARLARRENEGLESVWQERRAWALGPIRAALAAEGVESEVRGTAVLGLWQAFAPYAPADIVVRRDDAETAREMLSCLLVKEAGRGRKPKATPPPPIALEHPPSPRRRTALLGVGAAVALVFAVLPNLYEAPAPAPGPRASLEIVRVDDTIDPLHDMAQGGTSLPVGLSFFNEDAPVGPGRVNRIVAARMAFGPGEDEGVAVERFRRWLDTIALPEGKRFGLHDLVDEDENGKKSKVGLRSIVLTGEPILRTEHVEQAKALPATRSGGEPTVSVQLSPEGGQIFEDVTRAWTHRRIAIVINGRVVSAPRVLSAIAGGNVSITMGRGDPDQQLIEARQLARSLGGR